MALHPAIVACSPAVPEEILGWTCREFESTKVHYVYVKHSYRRLGIASFLIHGVREHSHHTRAGELLAKQLGSLFNPYRER